MRHFFQAIIAAAAFVASSAGAQQTWIPVSDKLSVRAGSFEMRKLRGSNEPIATVIDRSKLKNGSYSFHRTGMLLSDCERGYGKLRAYDIDSGEFMFETDYVNGGGTNGANLGDAICSLVESSSDGAARGSVRY